MVIFGRFSAKKMSTKTTEKVQFSVNYWLLSPSQIFSFSTIIYNI